jgi:hypothetical protein
VPRLASCTAANDAHGLAYSITSSASASSEGHFKTERLRGLDDDFDLSRVNAPVPDSAASFGEPSQIGGSSDADGLGNLCVECHS